MANELSISISLSFSKNGASISRSTGSNQITVAGNYVASGVGTIGTSAANLYKGDITTPGYMLFHNLDATNFIALGHDATGFVTDVKCPAGKWVMFCWNQTTPQIKADTAACKFEYYLFEA
jgi:hypothetical protein